MNQLQNEISNGVEALKKELNAAKISEIQAVYLHGPFFKDIDKGIWFFPRILIFVDTKEQKQSYEVIKKIKDIKKIVSQKTKFDVFGDIFSLEELKDQKLDWRYLWTLDILSTAHLIYGQNIDSQILDYFKKINYIDAKTDIENYFNALESDFPMIFTTTTANNSLGPFFNYLYDLERHVNLLNKPAQFDFIKDLKNKSEKEIFDYTKNLFIKFKKFDYEKMYKENLEITKR